MKQTTKNIWKNKMSIKNITNSALIITLLIVAKLIEFVIVDMPFGLGEYVPLFEITLLISVFTFDKKEVITSSLIYILCIVWISMPVFLSGLLWVNSIQTKSLVYLLDYLLPTLVLLIPLQFRNKTSNLKLLITLTSLTTMYFFHVISGYVFWSSYAWDGYGPFAYSLVANLPKFLSLSFVSYGIIKLSFTLSTLHRRGKYERWS